MKWDDIILDAQFGNAEAAGDAGGLVNSAKRNVREAEELAVKLAGDGDLSDSGRSKRLSEFIYDALNKLDGAALAVLGPMRKKAEELRKRLAGLPKETPDAALVVETRAALAALSEPDRVAVVTEAFATGELAVVLAVLQAPKFIQRQLLLPGLLDKLSASWAEARDPQVVRELRDLQNAIAVGARAVSLARATLIGFDGLDDAAKSSLMVKLGMDPIAPKEAA